MQNLARPEEFPAVVDALSEKLRSHGFNAEADRLHAWVHEIAWTTSHEFYGEVKLALQKMREDRTDLPPEIAAEVRRIIKSIDKICRWR